MRISTCSGGQYAGILDQRLECLRLRCRRLCYSVSSPLYHLPSILSPLSSRVFAGASVLSSRCNPVSCLLCRAPTAGAVGTFKSSPPPSLVTCVLGSHTLARAHTHTHNTRARAHTHTHTTHTRRFLAVKGLQALAVLRMLRVFRVLRLIKRIAALNVIFQVSAVL